MNKRLILLMCLLGTVVLSLGNCYYSKDGLTIMASHENNTDKSSSISASIDGRTLTIVFTENLGNVAIEITNASGAVMSFASLETPTGYQFFITNAGHYIVNFTLPNGDEYYGEFEVTE